MKYLTLTAAATALLFAPTTANAQFFGSGFDNSSVLGGLGGAGIGGALGSRIAGSGNRTEGAAIGAVLGGLAGTSYGNSRSNFSGNPYAGSFNPGFSGSSLLGTTAGAGIGGVIGSNLAGSGQRQEGTAIGAVVGGLAGYALTNRSSRYGNQGVGGKNLGGGNYAPAGYGGSNFGGENFAPASFGGGSSRYGSPAPALGGGFGGAPNFGTPNFGAPNFGGGFVPPSYGPGFGAPSFGAPGFGAPGPQFGAGLPSAPIGGTSFAPGGFVNAGTFANTQTIRSTPQIIYVQKAVARQPVQRPALPQTIVVKHRLPAPAPRQVIVRHVYEQAPAAPQQQVIVRHEYEQAPAPSIPYAPTIAPAPDAGAGGSYLVTGGQSFQAPSSGEIAARCAGGAATCSSQYSNTIPVAPTISPAYNSGTGGSYHVTGGQSFQAPSANEVYADCSTSTFGCAGSYESSPSYSQPTGGYASQASGYSYCGSDKVYNEDGAQLLGASPVCRN